MQIQIYPPVSDEVPMDIRYQFIFSDEVYRFRYTHPVSDEVPIDIRYQFIFSDEVYRFRYTPLIQMRGTQTSDMSSYLQMMHSDSDIPISTTRKSMMMLICGKSSHSHHDITGLGISET